MVKLSNQIPKTISGLWGTVLEQQIFQMIAGAKKEKGLLTTACRHKSQFIDYVCSLSKHQRLSSYHLRQIWRICCHGVTRLLSENITPFTIDFMCKSVVFFHSYYSLIKTSGNKKHPHSLTALLKFLYEIPVRQIDVWFNVRKQHNKFLCFNANESNYTSL